MTKQKMVSAVTSLLVAVVGIVVAQDAAAQGPFNQGGPFQGGFELHGGHHSVMPVMPQFRHQFPVYVSPNRIVGVNPFTGGLNSRNEQIDNTYFDYGRNGSQNNGSKRWVHRPIYDAQGNISGYSQGFVWNNSITGQEHGNVRDVTPNGIGGEHLTIRAYSPIAPSGK